MPRVGTVSVGFEADTSKFIAGINHANKALGSIQKSASLVGTAVKAMIAYFGVHELIAFSKETFHAAEQLGKLSIKLKASIKDIQGFTYAATQSGLEADQFTAAWQRLTQQAQAAASGISTRGVKAFDALGISVKDFVKLTADQQILVFTERLRSAESAGVALAAATRLVGRGGADLVAFAQQGAESIIDLKNKWDSLNASLSGPQAEAIGEMGHKWKTASDSLKGLGMQIVAGLAKPLGDLADWITTELPKAIRYFLNLIADMANSGADWVDKWNGHFISWLKSYQAFLKAVGVGARAMKASFEEAFSVELPDWMKQAMTVAPRGPQSGLSASAPAPTAAVGSQLPQVKWLEDATDILGKTTGIPLMLEGVATATDMMTAALDDMVATLEHAPATARAFANVLNSVAEAIHPLNTEIEKTEDQLAHLDESMQAATFNPAWDLGQAFGKDNDKAWKKLFDTATKNSDLISKYFVHAMRDAVDQFGNDFIEAFLNMAEGAKDAFKGMASGILKDLARIILKATLLRALLSAFNPSNTGWTGSVGKFLFPETKAAYGGDFTVPFGGGPDSNVVAFRASPGERITATPIAGMASSGGGGNVVVNQVNNFASGVDRTALSNWAAAQREQILNDVQQDKRRRRK